MKKIPLYLLLIVPFFFAESCSSPREGCGMDPSVDYEKVVTKKHTRKKKSKSFELFGKDRRKKMARKRGS